MNDLTGERYGRWLVKSVSHRQRRKDGGSRIYWACICDCGETRAVIGNSLCCGKSKSCGCLHREVMQKVGAASVAHGQTGSPEHRTWAYMRDRCNNKNSAGFYKYGGRGITINSEWDDFVKFYADMGSRPSSEHSIERIDNNGPYSKQNCKWATRGEQANNKRNNRFITWQGQTLTMVQWARKRGLHYSTLVGRLNYGWCSTKALLYPARKQEYTGVDSAKTRRRL